MSLGETLRQLREAKGWTQTRLAQESGVSQTYISDLEAGESVPTVLIALKLATALGVSIMQLINPFAKEASTDA